MKNLIFIALALVIYSNCFAQIFTENDVKQDYISCLDNQIYYEEVGEGKPLILAHAGFLDIQMWTDQFLYFANNGFRVIRFDSYAHGDKETGYGLCEEMGIDVDSKLGQVIHYLNYEVKITYKIVGDTVVPIKVNCGGEEGDCDVVPIKE